MEPMEQEFNEANAELERELWETLDRCQESGADLNDLRFLAWQCGATKWSPKEIKRAA